MVRFDVPIFSPAKLRVDVTPEVVALAANDKVVALATLTGVVVGAGVVVGVVLEGRLNKYAPTPATMIITITTATIMYVVCLFT
jgi:hypothetical protein